jgi:hypothetical protein
MGKINYVECDGSYIDGVEVEARGYVSEKKIMWGVVIEVWHESGNVTVIKNASLIPRRAVREYAAIKQAGEIAIEMMAKAGYPMDGMDNFNDFYEMDDNIINIEITTRDRVMKNIEKENRIEIFV